LDQTAFALLDLLALATAVSRKAVIFAAPAAIIWVAKLLIRRRRVSRLPLVLPMLALLIAVALVSSFAYDPIASWTRVRMFATLLLAVMIGETCTSIWRLKVLSYTLLLSTLLAVGWADWQRSFGLGVQFRNLPAVAGMAHSGLAPDDIVLRVNGVPVRTPEAWQQVLRSQPAASHVTLRLLHPQTDEPATVIVAAKELAQAGLDQADAVAVGHAIRASGFYQHSIPFAELLAMIGAFTWGLMLAARNRSRWILGTIFIVFTVCLAATYTRSAMAALLCACVVVLWQITGWRIRILALAVAVVLILVGSLWIRQTRGMGWLAPSDPGTQYRLVIWRDGLKLIAQHPVLGVGFDSIVRHPGDWDLEAYKLFPLKSHFHSTPIGYGAEGGLLTLAAWFWLLGAYFKLVIDTTRAAVENTFARGLALGMYGSFVAFFAVSLVHYTGGDSEIMTIFWFVMGLAIALHRILTNGQHASQLTGSHLAVTGEESRVLIDIRC
jgi:hypothetical protein